LKRHISQSKERAMHIEPTRPPSAESIEEADTIPFDTFSDSAEVAASDGHPTDAGIYDDKNEDDDDEEDDFEEPFSLLGNVVDGKLTLRDGDSRDAARQSEVIHYRDGELIDVQTAASSQIIYVGRGEPILVPLVKDGVSRGRMLVVRGSDLGEVVLRGRRFGLQDAVGRVGRAELIGAQQVWLIALGDRDVAQVLRDGQGYLVRFVYAPEVAPPSWRPRLPRHVWAQVAASVAFHFLAVVGVALAMPAPDMIIEEPLPPPKPDVLPPPTLYKPKEVQPKPPKPPKPPKTETSKNKAKKPTKHSHVVRKTKHAVRQPGHLGAGRGGKRGAGGRLVAMLNRHGAGAARSQLASLTNIRAVRTRGIRGGYRVAGLIGASSRVRLNGTLGTTQLRTKRSGRVALAAIGGTGTRISHGAGGAGFARIPGRRRNPHRIACSRQVVLRPITKAMPAIQRCYERALLSGYKGQGKAIFDWTIAKGGRVAGARLYRDNLGSFRVTGCVLRQIRRLRFGHLPCDLPIKVRFPFVFRSSSFSDR
jgi:hypothetical protein